MLHSPNCWNCLHSCSMLETSQRVWQISEGKKMSQRNGYCWGRNQLIFFSELLYNLLVFNARVAGRGKKNVEMMSTLAILFDFNLIQRDECQTYCQRHRARWSVRSWSVSVVWGRERRCRKELLMMRHCFGQIQDSQNTHGSVLLLR